MMEISTLDTLKIPSLVQKAGMSQCGKKIENADKVLIRLLKFVSVFQALHQIKTQQSSLHRGSYISLHRALIRSGQQLSVFPFLQDPVELLGEGVAER